ncbi:MAG: hypothetical protein QW524_03435 [Candidatus Woesearchaeota archaeon]
MKDSQDFAVLYEELSGKWKSFLDYVRNTFKDMPYKNLEVLMHNDTDVEEFMKKLNLKLPTEADSFKKKELFGLIVKHLANLRDLSEKIKYIPLGDKNFTLDDLVKIYRDISYEPIKTNDFPMIYLIVSKVLNLHSFQIKSCFEVYLQKRKAYYDTFKSLMDLVKVYEKM